ncbi:MAG: NnrS family protein [Chthoniobacterales bacterium]
MATLKRSPALCFAEPFRLFFPLGLLLGGIGVSLWPLFVWRVIEFYPATPHMRLMIEGMMGSFVIGFLGTAGPRLLDAEPLHTWEGGGLLFLQISSAALHLAQRSFGGDVFFLALLLFFLATLLRRAGARTDLPPPSFVLVIFGFANAIGGLLLILFSSSSRFWHQTGTLMLNEGFIALPILGVGAFFFPKLLGSGGTPEPADLQIGAALGGLCGLVFSSSFPLEAGGWTRSAALLRGLTSLWYFLAQGRLLDRATERPFLARCFQLGALLLVAGFFLAAIFPGYRLANLHVVFIGGFSVILFTVSTRVVLGHSGHADLFQRRLPFLVGALGLLVLAMLTRGSAEIFLAGRNRHLVYAALVWLIAAGLWTWSLGPKLFLREEE